MAKEFLTKETKYAVFAKGKLNDCKLIHYEVYPQEDGSFTLHCTHGDWPVSVDASGKAKGDYNFKDGEVMATQSTEINNYYDFKEVMDNG